MASPDMSKTQFTIAYDGEALRDGTMDVRDLAPALLAVGQLFDAANSVLNGEAARVAVTVRATHPGSFFIDLELAQSLARQIIGLLAGDEVTAAVHLKDLIIMGTAAGGGLFWLIRRLRGKKPDRVERVDADTVRVIIGTESIVVPLKVLRLYQDIAVRAAAERVVYAPLQKPGIDTFKALQGPSQTLTITEAEAEAFKQPEVEEEVLLEDTRRSAFSIVSLAFKEENKWRLHDGNNQISASITDEDFLRRVDNNEIAFAKGDVLICDVRVRQTQSPQGLKTEYTVERVVEHKPAARQLALQIEEPRGPAVPETLTEPPAPEAGNKTGEPE
jgi:hypothetical protein